MREKAANAISSSIAAVGKRGDTGVIVRYIGAAWRAAKGRWNLQFGPESEITLAIEQGVAQVRLNRPDKLNALNPAMMAALEEALAHLGSLDDLRCVVLAGEGRSFCAGIDLAVLASGGIGALSPRTHGEANRAQHCATGWRTLPVPVIAAITGHCFGAGMQIALGADLRIAASDARLSVMEMKHGLVPDLGGFVLARGLVREDQWRELVYTAREVTGDQAQAMGLVTRVAADPLAEATALARDIAGKSPTAIRAAKRLANMMVEDDRASLLQAESDEQQVLVDGLLAAMKRRQ
jgi:enoyl-CoA hydratase/carnithine racemase